MVTRARRHTRAAYQATRRLVLEAAGYRCVIHGPRCTERATTVDHIRPIVDGGSDDPANLRAACVACNSAGGAALVNGRRRPKGTSRRW